MFFSVMICLRFFFSTFINARLLLELREVVSSGAPGARSLLSICRRVQRSTDLGVIKRRVQRICVSVCDKWRDGRVGQEHVHQADANHSRHWLLGRRPPQLHQTRLSEHLHGDELHDSGHGHTAHRLQKSSQWGLPVHRIFVFWKLHLQHISPR